MKKCYAAATMIAAVMFSLLLMRAPKDQSAPTRRSDTKCSKRRNRWTAASWAGFGRAASR